MPRAETSCKRLTQREMYDKTRVTKAIKSLRIVQIDILVHVCNAGGGCGRSREIIRSISLVAPFHLVDSTASSSPATVDWAQDKRAMQTISSQSMMDHGAASCTVMYDLLCMKDGGERGDGRELRSMTSEARSRPQTAQQRAWRSWRFIGGDMGHFMLPTFLLCITQQIIRT